MKKANSRTITLVCLTVLFVIATTILFGANEDTHAQKITGRPLEEPFVHGRILVKFHDNVVPAHARNMIAALGARDAEELPYIGVHVLELPDQADERAAAAAFASQAEVEFAETDRVLSPAGVTPNDPLYPVSEAWGLRKIGAPDAWSVNTGSSNVIIAIVDTGVDSTHEDLASKIVAGWNIYDNNANTTDVYGHGTKVAGAASAASDNGIGVAAVAWGCKIMPIRISDTMGYATYSAMADGITWAANHGARVANLSYGGTGSSTVKSAAQYMQTKGGIVTIAAGNSGVFDSTPDNPYVLTVSATDEWDVLSYFSNTGNAIDLAAPEGAYTPKMGGGYSYAGGTSISAPIVAGVAALVISANPALTPVQVQDMLKQTADDLGPTGWDSSYGWGRVNAARAVALAAGAPTPTPTPTPMPSVSPTPTPTPAPSVSPTPTPTPVSDTTAPTVSITSPVDGSKVAVNTTVNVNASDNIRVTRAELYVDGNLTTTSTTAPFTTKWNTKKAASGAHVLQAKAYDGAGNAGVSTLVTVYK